MHRVAYTTCGLMLLTAVVAIVVATIRGLIVFGDRRAPVVVALLIFTVAFAVPIYVRGKARAFCNGFVCVGVLYFVVPFVIQGFGFEGDAAEYSPLSSLWGSAFDATASEPPDFHTWEWSYEAYGEPFSHAQRRICFIRSAHAITSLGIAAFGGMAAVVLQLRRREGRGRHDAGADVLIENDAQGEPIRKWEPPSDNRQGLT